VVSAYQNRKILVTGGLGFIGSNLAVRLVHAGARVVVVDSSVHGCGADRRNLDGVAADLRVIDADIGDAAAFAAELRASSVIFNLAGELSHIHSMRHPARDAELNAMSQLRFLEECARSAPGVRVVYASTRQIYGVPRYLPVDQTYPIQPVDFNGIHKYAATAYHLLLSSQKRLDAAVLCLSNIYGPRMALHIPGQGFLGNFLRHALLGRTIEVFGDGRQLRDPVYVDDTVDAFLLAGAARELKSRTWNVGGPEALPVAQIAAIVSAAAAAPEPVLRPFPEERKRIDTGSYSTDITRIREELGWRPRVTFAEGIASSLEYFRREPPDRLKPRAFQPLPKLRRRPLRHPRSLAV